MSGLGGAVAIIGTGTIKFGENFHQSLTDMICEAVTLVLADAGIELGQLQAGWNTQFDPSWNFTSFRATREAAKAAYKMAGVTKPAKQIKVAECHDCFTIAEIVNYEDLGFFEPGAGWRAVQAGETRLGGSLPVNKSGGLKSCGHPIGSSGIRMINNIHDQLLGRAGQMQVPGADMGLAHNLGGPGSVSAVAVLSQP
jgi:acetyl-CoA C-acetyltransferase